MAGVVAIALTFITSDYALANAQSLLVSESQTLNLEQPANITTISESQTVSATALFTQNCAGCHAHGGNVVRRRKTLQQKALKRYGYNDEIKIAQIITYGRGIMPAYKDRLTEEEIRAIAQYVKTQSENGW